jgi:hypothetical protein
MGIGTGRLTVVCRHNRVCAGNVLHSPSADVLSQPVIYRSNRKSPDFYNEDNAEIFFDVNSNWTSYPV